MLTSSINTSTRPLQESRQHRVSFLLNCFYTNMEMAGMNLTGAHGKSHPDKHIIESILGELLSVYLSNALLSVKINNGCNSKWL